MAEPIAISLSTEDLEEATAAVVGLLARELVREKALNRAAGRALQNALKAAEEPVQPQSDPSEAHAETPETEEAP